MEVSHFGAAQGGGQSGFGGPAKAPLLLLVTVGALQIGNPEEIMCKERIYTRAAYNTATADRGARADKEKCFRHAGRM